MTEPATSNNGLAAAVVDPSDTDAPPYAMFEIDRLRADGAFLGGVLLFERGEEFTVEISGGSGTVRLRARVITLDQGERPGMSVEFRDLSDADSKTLIALGNQQG